jgi:Glycosyltransferase
MGWIRKYYSQDYVMTQGHTIMQQIFSFLTSREDPFPLVVLEACDYELPIICFDNSGGMPAYVKNGPGFVVPFEDVGKMAEVVSTLLEDENLRLSVGKTARTRLHTSHVSEIAVPQILHECLTIDKKF